MENSRGISTQAGKPMKVVLVHAYSSKNSGDALLVDESVLLLERLGISRSDIRIVALDPQSFPQYTEVTSAVGPRTGSGPVAQIRLAMAGVKALLGRGEAARLISEADAVVAVGGGYLRAGNLKEALTTLLAHGWQLRAAARREIPVIYLPQSIGPLRGPVGRYLRKELERVTYVALRDDHSMRELNLPCSARTSDLGLVRLARTRPRLRHGDGSAVIVARSLRDPGTYRPHLHALVDNLHAGGTPVRAALQSTAGTGNNDRGFASTVGLHEPARTLAQEIGTAARTTPSVVVSVRLHGCIEALLAGIPAIHLGYERKGEGAYSDLGLTRFLHNARDFSPEDVAFQVRQIVRSPETYWELLQSSLLEITAASRRHEEGLRRLFYAEAKPTEPEALGAIELVTVSC